MNLLVLDAVSLAFGMHKLLDAVSLSIEKNERICLVGRNGTGKSTLFKVISGSVQPDEGEVRLNQGLTLSFLEQELPEKNNQTIFDYVSGGLAEVGAAISRFHQLSALVAKDPSEKNLGELEKAQHEVDSLDGWKLEQRLNETITRLNLDADVLMQNLSGGWRRRAALAKALARGPDILLLDEPTNHLDMENILWLEEQIKNYPGAVVFITHDRCFADNLATRIIELDRGHISSWPGNFSTYQERKAEQLDAELRHHAEFDKKLAQEEAWIRQGIKARRTRNEGRVRALEKLRNEHAARRTVEGKASFNLEDGERSGKIVAKLKNVSFEYGKRSIVSKFSSIISRGDRIGLIGPNGSGKSTLIKLILGDLEPTEGTIKRGSNLSIAYFDQLKSQLQLDKSVIENVGEGKQEIVINNKARHVISYLKDFLFTPERIHTPVMALSGGERNRLLLAKIFSKASNLLILDEPTNDLDIETLELLEQILLDYQGTVILVSHDRQFLDNVVTSTIVFSGNGQLDEYVGGYEDYCRQRPGLDASSQETNKENKKKTERKKALTKLSYKDQRELDSLPQTIETLENQVEEMHAKVSAPEFYQQPPEETQAQLAALADIEKELSQAYERWDELETLRSSFEK